jgi:hypothetical protein
VWTLQAETAHGGRLLPNAIIFDEPEVPARLLEFAASQPQVLRCPNCRAVIVEDADGIQFFVAVTEPPRLYVDRANRDAFGGFGLQSPRTRSEAADQNLILEPSLRVLAYDDTGWCAEAHVETWVDDNDDLDPQRLVARAAEQ